MGKQRHLFCGWSLPLPLSLAPQRRTIGEGLDPAVSTARKILIGRAGGGPSRGLIAALWIGPAVFYFNWSMSSKPAGKGKTFLQRIPLTDVVGLRHRSAFAWFALAPSILARLYSASLSAKNGVGLWSWLPAGLVTLIQKLRHTLYEDFFSGGGTVKGIGASLLMVLYPP